jgi:hypothetical protein
VGTVWENDRQSFVARSKILAHFLKIKVDSANANFRGHGFVLLKPVRRVQLGALVSAVRGEAVADLDHWTR